MGGCGGGWGSRTFHRGSVSGKNCPMSGRVRAPRMASVTLRARAGRWRVCVCARRTDRVSQDEHHRQAESHSRQNVPAEAPLMPSRRITGTATCRRAAHATAQSAESRTQYLWYSTSPSEWASVPRSKSGTVTPPMTQPWPATSFGAVRSTAHRQPRAGPRPPRVHRGPHRTRFALTRTIHTHTHTHTPSRWMSKPCPMRIAGS